MNFSPTVGQTVGYVSAVTSRTSEATVVKLHDDGSVDVDISGAPKKRVPVKQEEDPSPSIDIRGQLTPQSYIIRLP